MSSKANGREAAMSGKTGGKKTTASNRTQKRNALFVRVMAIILALIMVAGVGFYIFAMIGGN